MESRKLGTTDVFVSPVILGTWAIGGWMWGGTDEKQAIEAVRASLDHGVTTIDTAPIYGMGESERVVAKAIEGRRDEVVLATKCGMRWDSEEGSEPWPQRDNEGREIIIRKHLHPDSIKYECEQSLKRLNTDYIDLYQIHWPDLATPPEESWYAMVELVKEGKVRAIGVSNYNVALMKEIYPIFPIASNQPPYSLIRRDIEKEILPFCRKMHISTIVYSPLERGLLTGNITKNSTFKEGDHRAQLPLFSLENRQRVLRCLDKIRPIAEKYKTGLAQVVINWTIHQPGITAALVGARNAEQAVMNAGALTFQLTSDELEQIRRAFDEIALEGNPI